MPGEAGRGSHSIKWHKRDRNSWKYTCTSTNYGFIIYTQVRMTKLLVMLSVYFYMYIVTRGLRVDGQTDPISEANVSEEIVQHAAKSEPAASGASSRRYQHGKDVAGLGEAITIIRRIDSSHGVVVVFALHSCRSKWNHPRRQW